MTPLEQHMLVMLLDTRLTQHHKALKSILKALELVSEVLAEISLKVDDCIDLAAEDDQAAYRSWRWREQNKP